MCKVIKFYGFIFVCFLVLSNNIKAQTPDYKGLIDYSNEQYKSPDAIRIIVKHLEKSATTEPLEELILWTNNGFPELHDKNNYWNTDPYSIYLCIVSSINYFIGKSQSSNKSQMYLETIEKLKKNGTIVYHLSQNAEKILNDGELEEEFLRLISLPDAEERARGLILGRSIAHKNRNIFNIYIKTIREDKSPQVKNTALHMIGTMRQNYSKEVALIALEELFTEKNENVRMISSILVKQAADLKSGWTKEDTAFLLAQMIITNDKFARKTIGVTVAKLTGDNIGLRIVEDKIPETLFDEFISQVKAKENMTNKSMEADALVIFWKEWWTLLIPKYTVKIEFTVCD